MDVQRINLIGLTSSRRQLRTNAYTVLILFVDGNDFSSCVRSVNLMRMLVCGDGEMSMHNEMGLMHLRPSIALRLCLRLADGTQLQRSVDESLCTGGERRLRCLQVGRGWREVLVREHSCERSLRSSCRLSSVHSHQAQRMSWVI